MSKDTQTTPETDAEAGHYDDSGCWRPNVNGECVPVEFARDLERRLAEALKRAEELTDELAYYKAITTGAQHAAIDAARGRK